MTNTKFRKRALLSSVAMLLVALVALGSATFAWFTTSRTANAQGVKMQTTAASGIVVLSESMKNAGADFAKTTILNAKSDKTADDTKITLDPASFTGTFTTGNVPVIAKTSSDDPQASRSGSAQSITSVNVASGSTGITKSGIYAEKVYIKSMAGEADVYVSNVALTINSASSAKAEVKSALYVLVTDDAGKVKYLGNSAGSAPANYLNTASGSITFPTTGLADQESNTAIATDVKLTNKVDASETDYVWVVLFLDGEDEAVYSGNVGLNDIVDSVNIEFSLDAPSGYGS